MRYLNLAGILGPALSRVKKFHEAAGFEVGKEPRFLSAKEFELQMALIQEEVHELWDAADPAGRGDLNHVAQEASDLLYVVLGFCVRSGIDISRIFDHVCAANDRKVFPAPSFREDGKLLKPEGWKGPQEDIKREMKHMAALAALCNFGREP